MNEPMIRKIAEAVEKELRARAQSCCCEGAGPACCEGAQRAQTWSAAACCPPPHDESDPSERQAPRVVTLCLC